MPHQHEHRTYADIEKLIQANGQCEKGKELSLKTFHLLAEAEADVHGKTVEEVHFHEVGALDSILDICLSCELFALLDPSEFIVSPLPIGDGHIHCAHGVIPSPAPAVQRLLKGVAVRPLGAEGESVTPTAIALLKAFGAPSESGRKCKSGTSVRFTVRKHLKEFQTGHYLCMEPNNEKIERLKDALHLKLDENFCGQKFCPCLFRWFGLSVPCLFCQDK